MKWGRTVLNGRPKLPDGEKDATHPEGSGNTAAAMKNRIGEPLPVVDGAVFFPLYTLLERR